MKEARYFFVPDAENQTELPTDEAMHAMRVLRLKSGDELFLMDGVGNYFRAQVTVAATHHGYYEILEKLPQEPQWKGHLHLGIAPTKMMDRMEWMMEKATEVGIDEVSFLNCKFSERRLVKLVRLDKIVTAAVKQSHKAWKPQVNEMVHFNHFLEQPIQVPRVELFDELRKPSDSQDATVLVGPEGDFSIDEVKAAVAAGWVSVSLGSARLRTETAGLAAVMMMQLAQK